MMKDRDIIEILFESSDNYEIDYYYQIAFFIMKEKT